VEARAGATRDALGAIALWSTLAALVTKLRHVPPLFLVGATLVVGGLVGAPRLRLRDLRPRVLAVGVYGLFAYHLLLFVALRLGPPIEVNLVNYLWPLLTVVLTPLFVPGARLGARHVAGALAGFAGAALLVTGGEVAIGAGGARGHLAALAGAFVWATYSLLTKRLGDVPTSTVSAFCLASGALALAGHVALEAAYRPNPVDFAILIAAGVGPLGAAFYLWDRAMKRGDPRVIGTLSYLTPLASTALVAWVTGARPGASALAAIALIVGGAALGASGGREAKAAAARSAGA
jgi:drug/metabolite transporter (DMT)-like permease